MLTGSNYPLGNQLQLEDRSCSWLPFRKSPIFICHVQKDTIYPRFKQCCSKCKQLTFPRLNIIRSSVTVAPKTSTHVCFMSLGGWGLQREFARNWFSIPGTCKGWCAVGVYLGVFLYTTGNRFKISVVGTRESDRVPLTDTKSNSLRMAELNFLVDCTVLR